jgi:hypothetical protein
MQFEFERISRWRERAEGYRVCAATSGSPGGRLTYRALAECADSVADRMEAKTLSPGEPIAPTSVAPLFSEPRATIQRGGWARRRRASSR